MPLIKFPFTSVENISFSCSSTLVLVLVVVLLLVRTAVLAALMTTFVGLGVAIVVITVAIALLVALLVVVEVVVVVGSSCGVLVCRTNRHFLGLHRSSKLQSTFSSVSLDTVHMVIK
jgi:hypothetical protein